MFNFVHIGVSPNVPAGTVVKELRKFYGSDFQRKTGVDPASFLIGGDSENRLLIMSDNALERMAKEIQKQRKKGGSDMNTFSIYARRVINDEHDPDEVILGYESYRGPSGLVTVIIDGLSIPYWSPKRGYTSHSALVKQLLGEDFEAAFTIIDNNLNGDCANYVIHELCGETMQWIEENGDPEI